MQVILKLIKNRAFLCACAFGAFLATERTYQDWLQRNRLVFEQFVEGCLPYSAYVFHKKQPDLSRYNLVFFKSKGMQPVADDDLPVGKMVIGVEGDKVRIEQGQLFINDELWGDVSYGALRFNNPMTFWDKAYTIPKGKIFVFGTEKRSWDSRYWGLLDAERVMGNIDPLF